MTQKLTKKHLNVLFNGNSMPDHLTHFVNKWHDNDDRPPHITDMLIRLAEMEAPKRRRFYIDQEDRLYYIDPKPAESFRYYANRGWVCTSKKSKKPQKS